MSTQNKPTKEPTQAQTPNLQAFLALTEEQRIATSEQWSVTVLRNVRDQTETTIEGLLAGTSVDTAQLESVVKARQLLEARIEHGYESTLHQKEQNAAPDTPEVVLSPEETERLEREAHERFERQKAVLEPLGAEVNTLVPLLDSTDSQQRLAALGRIIEIGQLLEAVMKERNDFSIVIFVGQLWTYLKVQLKNRGITKYQEEHVFFLPPLSDDQSEEK